MDTQKKTKPVCSECGSDNVLVDAFASWNPDTQRYELDNIYDQWQCFNEFACDSNDTQVDWVEVQQ